jgi:hypothetical protein
MTYGCKSYPDTGGSNIPDDRLETMRKWIT